MPQPKQKFFGNFDLQELTDAIKAVKANDEISEYKGKKQVRIGAAQWEEGNISIDIYVKATKTSYKIGQLRISTLDGGSSFKPADDFAADKDGDLPF